MSVIYNALKKVQHKQNNSMNQNFADRRDFYKGFFNDLSLPCLKDIYVFLLVPLILLLGYLFFKSSGHILDLSTLVKTDFPDRSDIIIESDETKRSITVEDSGKIENFPEFEENSHLIHNLKGVKYYNEREFSRALSEFEKAIAFKSDYAEPYNNMGIIFKKSGDIEKALRYYEKALLLNPEYAEALNNSGVLLLSMGRIKNAESKFKKAIGIKPSYADPYLNLAQSLDSSGSEYQALRYYEDFLKKSTGDDVQLIATVRERGLQIRSSSINPPN